MIVCEIPSIARDPYSLDWMSGARSMERIVHPDDALKI